MRVASGIFAALFLLSVVVQYNDPDPIQWMLLYGAAFVVSAWRTLRPAAGRVRPVAGLVMVVAVVWAALILPGALGKTTFPEMFGSIGMKNEAAEIGREVIGLFMVAFWMAVVAAVKSRPEVARR